MIYAVRNKKTGELISGTDFRVRYKNGNHKQFYWENGNKTPLLLTDNNGMTDYKMILIELERRGIDMRKHELYQVDVRTVGESIPIKNILKGD